MKVMSFNLRADNILDIRNRWGHRAPLIYQMLNDSMYDVIGLQEVTDKMHKDLYENVQGYHIIGEGRTKKIFNERNNLLIGKEHQILEHETFWISETPGKSGSSIWYSLFPRICTTAMIQLSGNSKVRVYNTHLDCILPQARAYGIKTIIKIIEKNHEKEQIPCILMGDFNATPNSKLIRQFSSGEYSNKRFVAVQDIRKEIYQETTMGKFRGKKKGVHIDYIFVTEEFTIQNAEIVKYHQKGKYPSDHYPIVAELKL